MTDAEEIELLEQEIADMQKQMALTKNMPCDVGDQDFDGAVRTIMKRDNCDHTTALSKARREAPEAFRAYQGHGADADEQAEADMDFEKGDETDFNKLVEDEVRKGAPRAVAGQRVINRYGARPDASQIRKSQSAAAEFTAEVDALMNEKRLPQTAAMQEVRKRHPDLFAAYQKV